MSCILRHCCVGSCEGVPASIVIDFTRPSSMIAWGFVLVHNVPRAVRTDRNGVAVSYVHGELAVPIVSGAYRSRFRLDVNAVRPYDIVLGADWMAAVGCRIQQGVLLDPDASHLPSLQWIPTVPSFVPARTSGGCSSPAMQAKLL